MNQAKSWIALAKQRQGQDDQRNGQPTILTHLPSTIRRHEDGLHPYAAAIRAAWLQRLDDLNHKPWQHGDAWDTNCFVSARKLIELANSSWAGYSPTQARADYDTHAPRNHAWDQRDKCWDQAKEYSGSADLPEPPPGAPIPEPTILDEDTRDEDGDGDVVERMLPRLDWHALFAAEDDGEEWIIEPIIAARRLIALYSAPKAGKSLLLLELAVAISRGTPVLDIQPDRPYRVLYVDFENDPRGDIRARLEAMEYGPEDLDNLCYLSFPSLAKLDTAAGASELLAAALHYQCEIVIIDTVSRAIGGEENDNNTWLAFYRHTGVALKQHGIACLRLDHSGKDAEKGMRGGSAKYGDVDAVWRLSALSESTIRLECTDHRMPVETTEMVLLRHAYPLHHTVSGNPREAVWDAEEQAIVRDLEALQVDPQSSANEQYEALRKAGKGRNRQRVLKVARRRKSTIPEVVPEPPGNHLEPPGVEVVPRPDSVGGPGTTPGSTGSQNQNHPTSTPTCPTCDEPIDDHLPGCPRRNR